MKKKLTFSVACLFAIGAFGQTQTEIGDSVVSAQQKTEGITTSVDEKVTVPTTENQTVPVTRNVVAPVVPQQTRYETMSVKEDTAKVTTINDIIKMQQEVTNINFRDSHYRQVWGRNSYLNLSYNSTTLTPDGDVPTGVAYNGGKAPEFKSNWGVSLQVGRSYALHKRPISNILQFNFDYTFIDLNVNHFKAENDGKDLYDSRAVLPGTDEGFYTPWNLEKYDFNYGMSVGPSITVAPFTRTKYAGLHHLKFNAYFHIGYHAALLYIKKNDKADVNQEGAVVDYDERRHNNMDKGPKLDFGHGLITSFGFSMTWKAIGIGYEHRSGKLNYKPIDDDQFGDDKYKFKSSTNRVFIQFRM